MMDLWILRSSTAMPRLGALLKATARASVLAAALAAGAAAAGCQPHEFVPTDPALLLPAERDALQQRTLVLENGLKVVLVSNPGAERSGAALAVGVGSLADPETRPGLAHFLEHMLFLGTDKYPDVGELSKFMSSNGGFSNAYTADDHTNYFFAISHDAFDGGLDRFAQFFVAPRFDPEFTEREMNAVDSEHAKNVESDYWRIQQVQRGLAEPSHPINHFSTGDLKTLRGIDRAELLAFYRRHYSSNLMTLAVVSERPLDVLEQLVRERFSAVPRRNVEPASYPETYLPRAAALRLLTVEPVKDQRVLMVQFPLPGVQQHYRSRPVQTLSSVLGHEGKGSLLSLLKAKGLATALSAGIGNYTRDYSSLQLRIELTPDGLARYKDVLALVLGAIKGLRAQGIPRGLYEEQRVMAELDYTYRATEESADLARSLAGMMQRLPLNEVPEGDYLLREYRPDLYAALLDKLTPDNMLVTLVARGVETDRSEEHYGTRYAFRSLTGADYQALVAAKPDARWRLPAPNPFIPKRITLGSPDGALKFARTTLLRLQQDGVPADVLKRLGHIQGQSFPTAAAYLAAVGEPLTPAERRTHAAALLKAALPLPQRLLDTERARLFHLPDWLLRQPKASLELKLFTESPFASPRSVMLSRLHLAALEEGLNEAGYPVREAGLSYNFAESNGGMVLSLNGYSARMLEVLQFLAVRLKTAPVDEATFASIKERMRRALSNAKLEQPYSQSRYLSRLLLSDPNYTREALLRELAPLRLEDVQAYAAARFRHVYAQGAVVGNLPPAVARAAVNRVLDTLGGAPLAEPLRVTSRIRDLPAGANWVFTQRLAVNNSLLQAYYQVGPTNPRLRGALLMIGHSLGEDFFFNMRTRQQLGYIVWAGMGQMEKTLSLDLLVQSGQYPADVLAQRIEDFVPGFIKRYSELAPETFESHRAAVIRAKLDRPKSMSEAAEALFWQAFRNDEQFDHVSEDIAAVEALSHADVQAVLERYLGGPDTRLLRMRLIGKDHDAGAISGRQVSLPDAVQPAAN